MRFATIKFQGREQAAVVTGRGLVPVSAINHYLGTAWPTEMPGLIAAGLSPRLVAAAGEVPAEFVLDSAAVQYGPLYRHPRKIWGIGLNYKEHQNDLGAPFPVEPASFIKGDHTIVGPGDEILLPPQSKRVTAEAEIGVIIGKECYQVSEEAAPAYIAGVCLILDQTAEDILQVNPRFLTRAKNFPTFFSFGPELITMDEVNQIYGDIHDVKVATVKNGSLHRENVVRNMAYPPYFLVSFHSHVMPLYPGDIISTGTPGAVVIENGDVAECRVEGLGVLKNPVRRLG